MKSPIHAIQYFYDHNDISLYALNCIASVINIYVDVLSLCVDFILHVILPLTVDAPY